MKTSVQRWEGRRRAWALRALWVATTGVATAAAALVLSGSLTPTEVDRARNRVRGEPPSVSRAARALHEQLTVADLHCDALLWARDLNVRNKHGHVDVPRLLEGRVALQVFAVPTVVPRSHGRDLLDSLATIQGWPATAARSPLERALLQARRLRDAIGGSGGLLRFVGHRGDLIQLEPRGTPPTVGALLALEGAHALEGNLAHLDTLHAAGFRMITLAHFTDNAFAGSAHGKRAHGLTPLGRELVRRMETRGMVVDVSHASPAAVSDVLSIATRPVVASHSGVQGTCPNRRNLTDEQLRAIARQGGVVGIGFWNTAVCGDATAAIVRAIRHAVSVAGVDHVGLGSDFDGSVTTPFDAAHLSVLTDALLADGFSQDDIRQIMGMNVLRVLGESLGGRNTSVPSAK